MLPKTQPSVSRGFTLLEALLSLGLLALVSLGLVGLTRRAANRAAVLRAAVESNEQAEIVELMKAEVESAGYQLTTLNQRYFGEKAAQFALTADYIVSGAGSVARNSGDGAESPLEVTTVIESTQGAVAFTLPATGWLELTIGNGGADGTGARRLRITAAGGELFLRIETNAPTRITNHQPGTAYRLSFFTQPGGGRGAILTRGSETSGAVELSRTAPVFGGGVTHSRINITDAGAQMSVTLTGVPVRDAVDADGVRAYALPRAKATSGARLSNVLEVNGGTNSRLMLLRGDLHTGAVYLASDLAETGGAVITGNPGRGELSVGDYLLTVDQTTPTLRSALWQVGTSQPTGTGDALELNLMLVTAEAPAWGELYSDATDASGGFRAGAMVVKLAPPIFYFLSEGRLVRACMGRNETVALNVQSLGFSLNRSLPQTLSAALKINVADASGALVSAPTEVQFIARPLAFQQDSN